SDDADDRVGGARKACSPRDLSDRRLGHGRLQLPSAVRGLPPSGSAHRLSAKARSLRLETGRNIKRSGPRAAPLLFGGVRARRAHRVTIRPLYVKRTNRLCTTIQRFVKNGALRAGDRRRILRRSQTQGGTHMISSNRARRAIARVAAVALLVSGSALMASSVAFAASADCNGVFPGGTPDPIQKLVSPTTAHQGDTVTVTIKWHSTGVSTADVTDCFRVDDGSNSTLNAIVTPLNVENDVTNQGNQGDEQTLVATFVVPSDPSLVGHSIVDRAKITHGSVESKSDLLSVAIV